MKRPSDNEEFFKNLIGLGKSSVQKSYYPQLQKKISELEESEERYRLLADNITDIIWMVDMNLDFLYVSPSAERLTGQKADTLIHKNISMIMSPDSAAKARSLFKSDFNRKSKNSSNKGREFEINIKNKMGTYTPVEVVASFIFDETGQPTRILGVSRDITERKKAQEEKEKIQEQLQQVQKMESIGTLAGGIAHDFNNLLTIINGYSEIALLKLTKDSSLYNDINSIKQAGERAQKLTSQLLAFSRKQIYRPEIVNINDVIISMQKMLRRLIDEDISIESILGTGLPSIKADVSQLEQIFINLCANARDAIRNDSNIKHEKTILIETSQEKLNDKFLSKFPDAKLGKYVCFSVSDNGEGMENEVISKIFEPFFTTKEKFKGTGLGLSMVYGIVKQNESHIDVVSKINVGTKFQIYWPICKEEKTEAIQPSDLEDFRGNENILVVEDDIDVCEFAVASLKSFGYQVYSANNGKEALNLINIDTQKFDLIISDLIMPEMNGKDFIEKVKKIIPGIKVIFVSGYTDDHIVRNGLLKEGLTFLQKPYSVQSLAGKVRKILDEK